MDYENISDWTLGQNKPNSNPIKPNFQKAKMNVNSLITKDYRKNDDFTVRINKPNFVKGPKCTQTSLLQRIMKMKPPSGQKNKPNSNPISSKAKIACRKIWPHPNSLGLPGNCCNLNEVLILSDFK